MIRPRLGRESDTATAGASVVVDVGDFFVPLAPYLVSTSPHTFPFSRDSNGTEEEMEVFGGRLFGAL